MSTTTSAGVSAPSDSYERSMAILARMTEQWSGMEVEEEEDMRRAAQATKRLLDVRAEREKAMTGTIARMQRTVSTMRDRLGELQRDVEEDGERVRGVEGEKREGQEEVDSLVEKMKEYQARIDRLVRQQEQLKERRAKIEADADFKTTKIRKELILFSGFTGIQLDLDAKDRFVGIMTHPSGNPQLAKPVDLELSATNTAATYQLWNML